MGLIPTFVSLFHYQNPFCLPGKHIAAALHFKLSCNLSLTLELVLNFMASQLEEEYHRFRLNLQGVSRRQWPCEKHAGFDAQVNSDGSKTERLNIQSIGGNLKASQLPKGSVLAQIYVTPIQEIPRKSRMLTSKALSRVESLSSCSDWLLCQCTSILTAKYLWHACLYNYLPPEQLR